MQKQFFFLVLWLIQCCFLSAQPAARFTVSADQAGSVISPKMWGVFFEDINFGADGGLYAELVKNRSFEFPNPMTGWTISSPKLQYGIHFGSELTIINESSVSTNPRFLRVSISDTMNNRVAIVNEGFRGMGIKKDLRYDFSLSVRQASASYILHLALVSPRGDTLGKAVLPTGPTGDDWQSAETSLVAERTEEHARLVIRFEGQGVADLDMISLFPSDTWQGKKGGLRRDMVQALADRQPGFLRFPGGCIVEGRDLSNRYQWKETIRPLAERKTMISRWNNEINGRFAPDYFQSFGLGFFEYFQLAEAIGAAPLPILNCGMACQFNTSETVSLKDLEPFVQDALDLIEFANGDSTTPWGRKRADLGHPAPYHMTMLGVGNENWGPGYIERLAIFQRAIAQRYPEIQLVCSTGFMPEGELFTFLDTALRRMQVSYVDEHYYNSPAWFLANAKRYDAYDRSSVTRVMVGEYAAQSDRTTSPSNKNNWRTALAEAAFMTGLERNADIIRMAAYAPLFGHTDAWQWRPDMIWVDNLSLMRTPNYYVQMLYMKNRGTRLLQMQYQDGQPAAGQDSLYASAVWDTTDHSVVVKIANTLPRQRKASIAFRGKLRMASKAEVTVLQQADLEAENTMGSPEIIRPQSYSVPHKKAEIELTLEPYSFTVLRISLLR